MNRDQMQGQWKQLKGEARTMWGKLTDDDLEQIQGNTETLVGRLQERYGYARAKAEEEVNHFLERHPAHP
ncbi:MAG: CsbD family protein [Vicinamibacterales bacterium]